MRHIGVGFSTYGFSGFVIGTSLLDPTNGQIYFGRAAPSVNSSSNLAVPSFHGAVVI
jgi:hypothetical protein